MSEATPISPDRPLLLVVAVVAIAGAQSLAGGFIEDDFQNIDSRWIKSFSSLADIWTMEPAVADARQPVYRPIAATLFLVDHALFGPRPAAFHATNLILHLACATLVFFVARRLTRNVSAAVSAALLLGLHPVPVEAWAYISARADLIATLFLLATLLAIERAGPKPTWRAAIGVGLVAFLACLGKETALIGLLWLCLRPNDAALTRNPTGLMLRPRVIIGALVAAGATYFVIRSQFITVPSEISDSKTLIDVIRVLPILFGIGVADLVVPNHTARRSIAEDIDALDAWAYGAVAGAVIAVMIVMVLFGRRRPLLAWGTLGFAVCLAPGALGVIQRWDGLGRYFYLPLACLAPAVGAILAALWTRLKVARLAIVGYAVILATVLQGAIHALRDDRAVATAAIDDFPKRSHGYALLGSLLCREGQLREGASLLEHAIALSPPVARNGSNYFRVFNLALCHFKSGRFSRALEINQLGQRLFPMLVHFRLGAAHSFLALGDRGRARAEVEAGQQFAPNHPGLNRLMETLAPRNDKKKK